MRRILVLAVCLGLTALPSAQVAAPRAFDVVSVKPLESNGDMSVVSGRVLGRFTAANSPLQFVLLYAFRVMTFQLTGAPPWVATTRFNITGTYTPGEKLNEDEVRERVRTLLADRFHMVAHHEMHDVPAYALVLARADGKLGPQLQRSDIDCTGKPQSATGGGPSPVTPSRERPTCAVIVNFTRFITGGTQPMSVLASNLGAAAARPVIDKTGLTGNFNFDAQWGNDGVDDVSVFTALQEQLGLKLESTTTRADVVVIDRLDHPTEN